MAATTVSGSIGGTSFTFTGSTAAQNALAAAIISSATGTTASLVTGAGGAITSATTIVTGTGSVVTGSASFPLANVVLNGSSDFFFTGSSAFSQVVAADGANATIVNNNPTGGLIADTGAGSNLLAGFAGVNSFTTGIGGNDLVVLNGVSNTLVSNGSDAILVGGPSTITAGANAIDNIAMTNSTSLAFINGSKAGVVDTVTGATGATITLAGTGSTSVSAGVGPLADTFYIDTSAGNTTLNNNSLSNTSFEFVKDANAGTAVVTVNNFVSTDSVLVHGYSTFNVGTSGTGSVLLLSDGSQVTFSNVSAATLSSTIKVV